MPRPRQKTSVDLSHLTPSEAGQYDTLLAQKQKLETQLAAVNSNLKLLSGRHYTRERYARLGPSDRYLRATTERNQSNMREA